MKAQLGVEALSASFPSLEILIDAQSITDGGWKDGSRVPKLETRIFPLPLRSGSSLSILS